MYALSTKPVRKVLQSYKCTILQSYNFAIANGSASGFIEETLTAYGNQH